MPLPALLSGLRLPAIVAPMFLVSGPDLVVAACRAGLVGTFPALNARTGEDLDRWLGGIGRRLAADGRAAPFGVNLIVHRSNPRLRDDLGRVVAHRVPLVITSLGATAGIVDEIHAYGGLVFHDVISLRHAEKAAAAGVDGIIAVAAGAGGHAGALSPFALVGELRQMFGGTVVLAGAVTTGSDILAARAMGADMVSIGTRFIVTRESLASDAQKEMTRDATAADIIHTSAISGVAANFLRPSLVLNGLDPDNLPPHGTLDLGSEARVWKTVWSAGQGVGRIADIPAAGDLCDRLAAEYRAARARIAADPFG
ncbi:MAG: NAD(P)H-dependent flavin oxidoreductase [Pseudomonadota bacterium]